ncbi:MAG: hypothetical protein ACK5LU_11665 [Pseudanabaena sp.]
MFKIKQRAPFTTTNLIAYFPIKQRSPLNTHTTRSPKSQIKQRSPNLAKINYDRIDEI